jgi:hypothetical protein
MEVVAEFVVRVSWLQLRDRPRVVGISHCSYRGRTISDAPYFGQPKLLSPRIKATTLLIHFSTTTNLVDQAAGQISYPDKMT